MFKNWPVRYQIHVGALVLFAVVLGLSVASLQGVFTFRKLTKSIRQRAHELPLAAELGQTVSDLRRINVQIQTAHRVIGRLPLLGGQQDDLLQLRLAFYNQKLKVRSAFLKYQKQLESEPTADLRLAYSDREEEAVVSIHRALDRIDRMTENSREWTFETESTAAVLERELETLQHEVQRLPGLLQQRMQDFAVAARADYHAWFATTVTMLVVAISSLIFLFLVADRQIFKPLDRLIRESRQIAKGDYEHQIQLQVSGEVAELAEVLNAMTANFQAIKTDLDRQVRERTKEVIRSEQLASVGFLAAGLAHEINNPLAGIAWSAEALETQVKDAMETLAEDPTSTALLDEVGTILKYLTRIQDEAFRCKGITSALVDYSRLDNGPKQKTEMVTLVRSVIDMIIPARKYKDCKVHFKPSGPVYSQVNPQEMKQVVMNLLTNALESLEGRGNVWVELSSQGAAVQLEVRDDGCGMTEDVRAHLFEPFYTKRADGSGTGLGLTITHRIIDEHQGSIRAFSQGPGHGSKLIVCLPMVKDEEERLSRAA